jgi:3-hydroxyisobutyrate dehydrogenase-like beta-hydroxyacid dehydrogenase
MKVGFIGLGIMGAPMAANLIKGGHQLFLHSRSSVPPALVEAGGTRRMVKRTFDPGFRIALHQKDLNLALSTGRSLGVSLPNTATCQELFNSCAAHGGAAQDHSAMVRALERMANFEIGASTPAKA